jgi:hypothetical protein
MALLACGAVGCDEGSPLQETENTQGSSSAAGSSASAATNDTVFAPLSFTDLGNGVWSVEGTLAQQGLGLKEISLVAQDAQGHSVGGLSYYTLAEVAVAQNIDWYHEGIFTVAIGPGGLDARLSQRDLAGACGKLVVTATAACNGYAEHPDGSSGTVMVYGRGSVTVPCTALSAMPAPMVAVDANLAMDGLSWIGDATLSVPDYYSAELDAVENFGAGGTVWGTYTLTPAKAGAVDILFDGTHLLTPYGAVQAGFHARFFQDLANETVLVPLDDAGYPTGEPVHSLAPTVGLTFAVLGTGKTPVRVEVQDEDDFCTACVQLKINR